MEEETSQGKAEAGKKAEGKTKKRGKQKQESQKDICALCGEGVIRQKEMWLMCGLCGVWCHLECTDSSGASTSAGYVCDWCRA